MCAGRYDGIAPVADSELIVAGITDSRFEIFEGGHLFMLQDPRSLPNDSRFPPGLREPKGLIERVGTRLGPSPVADWSVRRCH